MGSHVVLLAKCLSAFRAFMLFNAAVRNQMLIQLWCGFETQWTLRALLIADFRMRRLQMHANRWPMYECFVALVTFVEFLVRLPKQLHWIKTRSKDSKTLQLTWILMWRWRFALCLTIWPQMMHLFLFSCFSRCASNASALLSHMPQNSQRKLLSLSVAGGTSVSSFDFWSISWFCRICAFISTWLANTCWHTPHFFCLWYCSKCACGAM